MVISVEACVATGQRCLAATIVHGGNSRVGGEVPGLTNSVGNCRSLVTDAVATMLHPAHVGLRHPAL
jgi:hypothetical protein